MIKGHTTIELKDVNTGEVTRYEDDNMLTNAISKMIAFASSHSIGTNPLSVNALHWENLLGGLAMFDTALTENANNIWLGSGVKTLGCGQVGNSTNYSNCPNWGLYNEAESDTSSATTKKFVWDFGTDKANGTHRTVCLTHKNAGLFGFGTEAYNNSEANNMAYIALGTVLPNGESGKQTYEAAFSGTVGSSTALTDGTYMDFCIDSDNNQKYMFKVCNDGLSIIKHKLSPTYFDVFQKSSEIEPCTEETYAETFSGTYFYHFYNTDEKVLYFWIFNDKVTSWQQSSRTVVIHKFDMASKVLTANWKTVVMPNNYRTWGSFAVTSTSLYYGAEHTYQAGWYIDVYKFSTGTVTQITPVNGMDCNYHKLCILNGMLYVPNAKLPNSGSYDYALYTILVDTTDDTFLTTNIKANGPHIHNRSIANYGGLIPPYDNTQMVFGTGLDEGTNAERMLNMQESGASTTTLGNVFTMCNYLGTINVLSNAVTKTATQTMKVSYTLTQAEE